MTRARRTCSGLVVALLVAGALVAPGAASARSSSDVDLTGPIFSALGNILGKSPTKLLMTDAADVSIKGLNQADAQFGCTELNGAHIVEEARADVVAEWTDDDNGSNRFEGSLVTGGICTESESGESFRGAVQGTLNGAPTVTEISFNKPASGGATGTFSLAGVTDPHPYVGCAKVVVDDATPTCGGGGGSNTTTKGRMTGGGKIANKVVAYNMTLNCDPTTSVQTLKVTWGSNRFDLTSVTSSTCSDEAGYDEGSPAAGFDTFVGKGVGTLNGNSGATIEWKLTDRGEPPVNDTAGFTIKSSSGETVLTEAESRLDTGNNQAHGAPGDTKAAKHSSATKVGFSAFGKAFLF